MELYYPFGLGMKGLDWMLNTGKENKFQYNDGTEKNTDFDLNWYETDYRPYDVQISRMTGVDALAGMFPSISPYVYSYNNPINFNDPTGLCTDCATDENDFTALAEKYAVKAEKIVDEQPTTGFENYVEDIYTKAKDVVSRTIKTTDDKFQRDKKTSKKLVEKTNNLFEDTQGLVLTGLGLAGKALFIYGSAALTSIFGAISGGSSTASVISKIANQYQIFKCIDCAAEIVVALKEAGVSGEILDIATNRKYAYIWSDALQTNISENGSHRAVMIDGIVYDNINQSGISYQNWIKDLFSSGGYTISSTKF